MAENFELQPENGIFIQSWYGEPKDRALFELAPLLKGKKLFFKQRWFIYVNEKKLLKKMLMMLGMH